MLRNAALCILLLSVVLLLGCGRARESGEKPSVTIGEALDTSALSLAIYPGSAQQGSHTTDTGAAGKYLSFVFTTTDSFEKVVNFYKDKYPDSNFADMKTRDRRLLTMIITEPPNMTSVTIQQADDGDQVSITLTEQK